MIVANVCRVRPFGEWHEPKVGLRWLRGGAKVYVAGGFGGNGFKNVSVIGRHRYGNRFFLQHLQARYLVDWRVQPVYSPTVLRIAEEGDYQRFSFMKEEAYREKLATLAASFAAESVRAKLMGGPCDGTEASLGPGEPPTQLLVPLPAQPGDGVRYARRAWDKTVAYYDHAPSSIDAP
jgi:hypothetical protein